MKRSHMKALPEKVQPPWEGIFSSFGDGLIILDTVRHITAMNPAAELITECSAESTLGHTLEEAFAGNEKTIERLYPSFAETSTRTLREMTWKAKGLKRKILDLSLTPLIQEDGELSGWIFVLRDITPLKNLEEEVQRADRLAMLGTMAAGLAHEVKNPLGGIQGAAQLLLRNVLPEGSAEYLQIIIKEVERVNRLVSRLLSLTQPKTVTREPMSINALLDSLLLLQEKADGGKKIQWIREFDPSLPDLLGNPDELKQAFLNFIKNSMEAVQAKSKKNQTPQIRVRTRIATDFKIKDFEGKKPSHVILVEIQDNGPGLSPENLSKIFTPFFTTKATGSGLGMVISQRIIQEHGGTIRLISEPYKGMTVQVTLRSSS